MLKFAAMAGKRSVPVANPKAAKVDAKAAFKLAMERYPNIISRLAK